MDQQLLEHLRKITAEEQDILAGRATIDRDLYMQGHSNTINSRKLLSAGKLITVSILLSLRRWLHWIKSVLHTF